MLKIADKNFRVFEMFSGIGGFAEAFRREGHEVIGHSEIDKYADSIYSRHFSNRNYGDATRIIPEDLPEFDVLCGGFPCQAFSIAGKRRGFEDTRGTLFFEIARIAKVKRPKYLLLENVKGLLNHDKGKTFGTIISTLVELGYDVEWGLLNTRYFGIPQNRERVFIVGSLGTGSGRKVFPIRQDGSEINDLQRQQTNTLTARYEKSQVTGSYVIERELDAQNRIKIFGESQGNRVYTTNGTSATLQGLSGGMGAKTGLYAIPVFTPDRLEKRQNGRRFKEDGESMFTLNTQDRQGVCLRVCGDLDKRKIYESNIMQTLSANPTSDNTPKVLSQFRIRRLTPTECERLQGFSDGWTGGVSDTQRYKCLGNALSVCVAQAIVRKMI